MTELNQIYKCEVCGNIVEVLHPGVGKLVCCDQEMRLFKEDKEDKGYEKHVPVVEKTSTGIRVKVGLVPHPMEEVHYIEWIEVIVGSQIYRKFLKPGEKPEAEFAIKADRFQVREYCMLHGLWST